MIHQIEHLWKLRAEVTAGRVSSTTAIIVSTVAAPPPSGASAVHLGNEGAAS